MHICKNHRTRRFFGDLDAKFLLLEVIIDDFVPSLDDSSRQMQSEEVRLGEEAEFVVVDADLRGSDVGVRTPNVDGQSIRTLRDGENRRQHGVMRVSHQGSITQTDASFRVIMS